MLDWKTNLDALVAETMAFAKSVRVEPMMPRTVVEPNRAPTVNWTGSEREERVLEGERGEPNPEAIRPINVRSVQLTVGSPTPRPPSDLTEEPKPETAFDLPAQTQAAPSAPADGRAGPMPPLRKAIVAPDIYTASADRERAIVLRWVLRDIKANRLKLSPIDQHDLRDLIDMGLVEMRNDTPVLTNTGVDAIV
jgi:hypothetical protein